MSIKDEINVYERQWSSCKYKPEYAQDLLDHLSLGLSFQSFDVPGGVAYTTKANWCKRFPAFAQAREIGESAKLKMLEEEGLKMVKGGNVVAWKFMMNQHGLSERLTVEQTVSSPASLLQTNSPAHYERLQKLKMLHQRVTLEQQQVIETSATRNPVEPLELERSGTSKDDDEFGGL